MAFVSVLISLCLLTFEEGMMKPIFFAVRRLAIVGAGMIVVFLVYVRKDKREWKYAFGCLYVEQLEEMDEKDGYVLWYVF